MVEWEHANRDLPYQSLVRKLLPYSRLLFFGALGSLGISALLIGTEGTTELWRGIPAAIGFILWCFFLIAYWFDPKDGPFVKPALLSNSPISVNPWHLALGVPFMILAGFALLIFLIVSSLMPS